MLQMSFLVYGVCYCHFCLLITVCSKDNAIHMGEWYTEFAFFIKGMRVSHALLYTASLSYVWHLFQIGQPKEQTQRQEQTEKKVRRTSNRSTTIYRVMLS